MESEKIVVKRVGQQFEVLEVSDYLIVEIIGIMGIRTVKAFLGESLNGRIYMEIQEESEEKPNLVITTKGHTHLIYGPIAISKVIKSEDVINPDDPKTTISIVNTDDIVGLDDDEIKALMDSITPYDSGQSDEIIEHFNIDEFRQKMGWI